MSRIHHRVSPLFVFIFILVAPLHAQQNLRVLFIGNSYTEVNNLPQTVADIAATMGDNLTFSSNTPGGCTFRQHCQNISMQLIQQGGWDAVVLQEQSQLPSFPQSQVENEVFPYAQQLVQAVYHHNPCAEPMFYMTWGRKNGDQQNAAAFPPLATYEGMDSLLRLRYTYMAQTYDAALCPVGQLWNHLRHNSNINLYQADESHPSLAGTYAAACAFYTMLFQRDPVAVTFIPDGLNPDVADTIRNATHLVVYNQLQQWKRPQPKAHFTIDAVIGNDAVLVPTVNDADTISWDFGDGTTHTYPTNQCQTAVTHHYLDSGTYTVTLTASRHCLNATHTQNITISTTSIFNIQNPQFNIYPNPARQEVTVEVPNPESDIQNCRLTILTTDGRTISQTQLQHHRNTIDIHTLPQGIYLLRIQSPDHTTVQKLIKP